MCASDSEGSLSSYPWSENPGAGHNETAFRSLGHACELITEWRDDYNDRRTHTSLGGLTPAEFAIRSNQGQSNDGLSL
jgi:putative transposase